MPVFAIAGAGPGLNFLIWLVIILLVVGAVLALLRGPRG